MVLVSKDWFPTVAVALAAVVCLQLQGCGDEDSSSPFITATVAATVAATTTTTADTTDAATTTTADTTVAATTTTAATTTAATTTTGMTFICDEHPEKCLSVTVFNAFDQSDFTVSRGEPERGRWELADDAEDPVVFYGMPTAGSEPQSFKWKLQLETDEPMAAGKMILSASGGQTQCAIHYSLVGSSDSPSMTNTGCDGISVIYPPSDDANAINVLVLVKKGS